MKYTRLIFLILAASTALSSCSSKFEDLLNSMDSDAKYKAAFEFFNEGKYNKSAQLFESLSVLTSGTSRDDTVQYYWGLSNYLFKDYYTAETNLTKFINGFPASPFTPEASYLRIDCLYRQTLRYELDQTPTYTAMAAMGEYIMEYPGVEHTADVKVMLKDLGERVDKKAYEAAKLYYHIEDYLAARVALKNVLKDDSDNIYREEILYYTAMSSYKYAKLSVPAKQKERYMLFADDYFNFIGELPESKYRKELDVLYKRSQKALGRSTGDLDEITSEKDFAKERKDAEKKTKEENKTDREK